MMNKNGMKAAHAAKKTMEARIIFWNEILDELNYATSANSPSIHSFKLQVLRFGLYL